MTEITIIVRSAHGTFEITRVNPLTAFAVKDEVANVAKMLGNASRGILAAFYESAGETPDE